MSVVAKIYDRADITELAGIQNSLPHRKMLCVIILRHAYRRETYGHD